MSRATKRTAWLVAVGSVLLAQAWYEYTHAVAAGHQFEQQLTSAEQARESTLHRYAKRLADQAGTHSTPALLDSIVQALEKPGVAEVSPAIPVAHALLLHSPSVSASLVEDLNPLVQEAHAETAKTTQLIATVQDAYREALREPWNGYWLRVAGFPVARPQPAPKTKQ